MNSEYKVANKPQIMIVGIECRTANTPEAGPRDIPKLWDRFYKEDILSKIPNKISNEIFGLYCDYEGDYTKPYTLVIGCQVDTLKDIPQGMVGKTIPQGPYATFHAIGEHPQSLVDTWEEIWQSRNLPRTYSGDYELYGDKFFLGSPQEVAVYIAVEN